MAALFAGGWWLSRKIDPFVKKQAVAYLQTRFSSSVNLRDISVSVSFSSPVQAIVNRGRGGKVHVRIQDLTLDRRAQLDRQPVIRVAEARAVVDLASLWSDTVQVGPVELAGLDVTIPPGRTPSRARQVRDSAVPAVASPYAPKLYGVSIDSVHASNARLTILPKNSGKAPLIFDIRDLHLQSVGPGVPLRYTATLMNAKPPGQIRSEGSFGPWDAASPAETPLSGSYDFDDADLGVFKGIGGTLSSTGNFKGRLSVIQVEGESRTPDFRLKSVGTRVPLYTRFSALVDGTNGNTLLQPLVANLASSQFSIRGGIVRGAGEKGKTVDLDVHLVRGAIEDLLRLAMKDPKPFLRGRAALKMKFVLPPGRSEIAERLTIAGTVSLDDARFTSSAVSRKLDELSRRGQGQPGNMMITEVPARLAGDFEMAAGRITFSRVGFSLPGAAVDLTGHYDFGAETMNFRGSLKLDARVSQTQTGWKRWALKPANPFFSKHGAGTYLPVAITGSASAPEFALDR